MRTVWLFREIHFLEEENGPKKGGGEVVGEVEYHG